MNSVLEILTRLRADLEGQIAVLESRRFRVLAMAQDGTTETDCTSVHLALVRSALAELQTAISVLELLSEGRRPAPVCEEQSGTL